MDGRAFLGALALLAVPPVTEAQPAGKVYRLGVLSPGSPGTGHTEFFEGLRELGHVEGRDLAVERRYAEGKPERMRGFARDVIVAVSAPAVEAARHATTTIPIIMAPASEPVERGFVAGFARPGGNITGMTYAEGPEIAAKRLQLLRETVLRAVRVAALGDGGTRSSFLNATQKAASSLGVKLIGIAVREANYVQAFATIAAEWAGALVVLPSATLNRDRKHIIDLAARYRLPAIYEWTGPSTRVASWATG